MKNICDIFPSFYTFIFILFHYQSRTNSLPRREMSRGANGPSAMTGSFVNSRNRDYSAPRIGGGNSRPLFGTMGGSGPSWTDSMPRRDFYSNVAPTGSLPRRDKAGLGRPEPGPGGSKLNNNNGIQPNNSMNGGKGIPPPTRRRESSLSRDNTSSFAPSSRDKRNSTGNLYFSDSLDGGGDRSDQSDLLARLSNNIQHQHSSLREDLLGGSANGSMTSIESTATLGSSTNDLHGSTSAVSAELRTAAGREYSLTYLCAIFHNS